MAEASTSEDFRGLVEDLEREVYRGSGQTREQVRPFARRYGPLLGMWAARLLLARSAGDAARARRMEFSFRHVAKAAVVEAATLGVRVQAAGEQGLLRAIDLALKLI